MAPKDVPKAANNEDPDHTALVAFNIGLHANT